MKKIIKVGFAAVLLIGCTNTQNESVKEDSQETIIEEIAAVTDGFYGEEIEETGAVAMASFMSQMESNDSLSIKIKGTIEKTCKMKGCWMTIETSAGETMRVSFKDYGFFVPQEGMEGKEVIISGTAKRKLTSVQELKHFAQDGGATKSELDAITQDSEELTFMANGVIIKNVKIESSPN